MSAESARSVSRATGVDRVRALQRVLYRCAKQDQDRRFHALYDKVARSDVLWKAWGEVRANRGAPGVDGVTIEDVVRSGVGDFLDDLAERLRAGTYRPRPLRRVQIPKPGKPGQLRPLGIPCVADRVVMAAAKTVLEPVFEADFLPSSYGFRPGLLAHHALETVRQTATWRGKMWVLDADIRSCFDEIDHDALVAQIERRVCDRPMLKLLRGWLRAGVFEGGIVSAIEAGTPQGSPISPLLANVALHVLDQAWQGGGQRLGVLVKYADDLVVLCATREQAEQPASSWRRSWTGSGCGCIPRRPGSRTSQEALRASRFSASSIGCESRGSSRVVGICRSGRLDGRWPRSEARFATARTAATPGCRWSGRSRISTAFCVVGATTSATGTPGGSSPRSTATSTNASRSSPAPSTDSKAELGRPLQLRMGQPARRLSPERDGETNACVCQPVNDVGEPCAGEPLARFDAAAGGNPGQSASPRGPGSLPPTLRCERLASRASDVRNG